MHIRGSPYCASFDEDAPPKNNEPTGPLMINFVTQSLNDLENFILDTTEGITIKNKNFAEDVKGLLKIKGHTEDVE